MIVEYMQENGVFENFKVQGTSIIVGQNKYNLNELQGDEQNIIEIKEDDRYIAVIIIPPAKYIETVSEEISMITGDNSISMEKQPLDMNAVRLVLWAKQINNTSKEGE